MGGCSGHHGCKDTPSGRRLDELHVSTSGAAGKSYRAEKSSAQNTGDIFLFFSKQKPSAIKQAAL